MRFFSSATAAVLIFWFVERLLEYGKSSFVQFLAAVCFFFVC